jgi:hypothetical protein
MVKNNFKFSFKNIVLILFLTVCIQTVAKSNDSLYRFKIGVLPAAFYSPETRIGIGGLIYSNFKTKIKDTLLRKSNMQSYITYTQNKQFSFENDYQLWLKGNKYYFTGYANYSRFPELFFGIGNETLKQNKINVSFDLIKIYSKNLILLHKNVYGGIVLNYEKLFNQDVALKDNVMCTEIFGGMGYEAKGIGLISIIDERDNPLNPAKGSYFEMSYIEYVDIIKNNNKFNSIMLDVRKYSTFYKKIIWNGNAYFVFNTGNVPYRMMPSIGGARFLRGYYSGRFRDNNLFILQQELRMPIYKALGVAAFCGIGKVAKTASKLISNTMHYNYGMGLRIRLNKKENTNLRIDYGRTADSHGLYIVYAEAF